MKGLQAFYNDFYGGAFHRHFRRPPDFHQPKFRIQFTVENPKSLYLHVDRNSGNHPCYVHLYDHGSKRNLKLGNPKRMVFDRAFFDFDVMNNNIKKVKKKLVELRSHGINHKKDEQEKLKEHLQNMIIKDKISEPAVKEAKNFAVEFKETFGKYPMLFFSGCKGCHAYTFFRATGFISLNRTISWFTENAKKAYNYQTLDTAVSKDAQARLSRVPYSKHQLTDLTVVPFTIDDSYDEIIEKSLNPSVESFEREHYSTNFHKHLQEIDVVEEYNTKMRKPKETVKNQFKGSKDSGPVEDHRVFFKSLLGDPVREYPEKEYVMYQCPFSDHEDLKPSFRVHKTGYYCYGCQRRGNYWQFLKDCYGWGYEEIKIRLISKKN
ncbi:CHC2 zinc finger domain-containing protein [Methanobacterium aggregans]|uniref:CHC2 zinc finger domain-containing protein n=1 Tax=Methanobacterium aggregans TaxID=1615586 RepID=UPI001AE70B17|nr:CHC2 zinc finger domain-containing protein [Methanobacterium aggregans]MBP2045147.1 hypothetical protein [Methanobacterium aggregans]